MTIEEFYAKILKGHPNATLEGNRIHSDGPLGVSVQALGTTLPQGVELSSGSTISIHGYSGFPDGVKLSARWCISAIGSTTIPNGSELCAGLDICFGKGANLSPNCTLNAGSCIDMKSMTELPSGTTLHAKSFIFLDALRSLPEDIDISAGDRIISSNLNNPHQLYRGKEIHLESVERVVVQMTGKPFTSKSGRNELWMAEFFNGRGGGQACSVAKRGKYAAFGFTAKSAIREAKFNELRDTFDETELVNGIRERGSITSTECRLLIGDCGDILRETLDAVGFSDDTERLPLERVIELSRGQYGEYRIANLFGGKE